MNDDERKRQGEQMKGTVSPGSSLLNLILYPICNACILYLLCLILVFSFYFFLFFFFLQLLLLFCYFSDFSRSMFSVFLVLFSLLSCFCFLPLSPKLSSVTAISLHISSAKTRFFSYFLLLVFSFTYCSCLVIRSGLTPSQCL
jgi:hypothetical protein